MYYEHFLFTRNQRQDFTAFIRPEGTTNSDVSALAGVIGYINEITWLTPSWGSLYCFPLGSYIYLLRHYDSGRRHAGRPITVLEGIAVQRTHTRNFAKNALAFIVKQEQYLNVIDSLPDIETQQVETSRRHNLMITRIPTPQTPVDLQPVIDDFTTQQTETRMQIPFTPAGLRLLIATLNNPAIPPLIRFAFGTNSDATRRLAELDIDLDIVSYFGTSKVSLRNRENNQPVQAYDDIARGAFIPPSGAASSLPSTLTLREQAEAIRAELQQIDDIDDAEETKPHPLQERDTTPRPISVDATRPDVRYGDTTKRGVFSPREMRRRAQETAAVKSSTEVNNKAKPLEETPTKGAAAPVLTPRQQRRRWIEEEAARTTTADKQESGHWLLNLLRAWFGQRK